MQDADDSGDEDNAKNAINVTYCVWYYIIRPVYNEECKSTYNNCSSLCSAIIMQNSTTSAKLAATPLAPEEEAAYNFLSFITNCPSVLYLRSPLPATLNTISKIVSDSSADLEQLALEDFPADPALAGLGNAVCASNTISSFTLNAGKPHSLAKLEPRDCPLAIGALVSALHNSVSLEGITVRGINTSLDEAHALSQALSCSRLSSVTICRCNLRDGAAIELIGGLRKIGTLNSICFEWNGIGNQAAVTLASALPDWQYLRDIKLHAESIGAEGAKALGAVCERSSLARAKSLDLVLNLLGDEGIAAVVEGLLKSYSRISKRERCLGTLQRLNLCSNNIRSLGGMRIARLVDRNPQLTIIKISSNHIREESGVAFGDSLKSCKNSLQELDAHECFLGSKGVAAICRALSDSRSISKLVLDGNTFGDLGARALGETLLSQTKSLSELNIMDNGISEAGAADLAKALSHNRSLKLLNLSYNCINGAGGSALLDAIPADHPLAELCVSNCDLGDQGAEALARFVQRSGSLRKIDAWDNDIRLRGAQALSEAMERSSSVEILWLGGNQVGTEGAKCIAEKIVRKSRTLRELGLWGIAMGDEGAKAVARAIKERDRRSVLNLFSVNAKEFGLEGLRALKDAKAAVGPVLDINI